MKLVIISIIKTSSLKVKEKLSHSSNNGKFYLTDVYLSREKNRSAKYMGVILSALFTLIFLFLLLLLQYAKKNVSISYKKVYILYKNTEEKDKKQKRAYIHLCAQYFSAYPFVYHPIFLTFKNICSDTHTYTHKRYRRNISYLLRLKHLII